MSAQPSIAIPVPTSFDTAYNERSWPEYARAVQQSGGQPVRIELGCNPAALRSALAQCTGVLLPGSGADVNPVRYGHQIHPETAPADALREQIDLQLLEVLEHDQLPLLAICFGLQSLNVYRGGALVQHLLPLPVNHRAGRAVAAAHSIEVKSDSKLGQIVSGQAEADAPSKDPLHLMVNSSHHQAVAFPGDGLQIAARSGEDSVIEALEDVTHPWMIGVQWHPERTIDSNPASRAIFLSFISAARAAR